MTEMEFRAHHSQQLLGLFRKRPYQGQNPRKSKIIFLSSDANYSPEITDHPFFQEILEYQSDGVGYWKKNNVHHPFLANTYPFDKTQNGRPFHKNFSKLGLDSSYAENISFVELLDIPTIGNKSDDRALFYSLASKSHLEYLDKLFTDSDKRLIFVSGGVLRDMINLKQRFQVFDWLPNKKPAGSYHHLGDHNELREIYHFSSSHIHRQLSDIRSQIDEWLFGNTPKG